MAHIPLVQRKGKYLQIPKRVYSAILARLTLALVMTAYMLIFNLFMRNLGYDDAQIAGLNAWPHFMILLLALPVGLLIKGMRLKPFYLVALVLMPLGGWVLPDLVAAHEIGLARLAFIAVGISWMISQVVGVPFVLRNSPEEVQPEGIALNYATFAMGNILSGGLIWWLTKAGSFQLGEIQFPWDEYHILKAVSLSCLPVLAITLFLKEQAPVVRSEHPAFRMLRRFREYDWQSIVVAMTPTFLIAVGAGLTIPFINLFFNGVFGITTQEQGIIGLVTSILTVISSLIVPRIRRKYGYRIAITLSQVIAVSMLVLMALTELYAQWEGMAMAAVAFYMLRTPFMNMAAPMTTELTMAYVGPANQELMSALTSSIWSGSWFVSAKIFQWFRQTEMAYYQIFLITAVLYVFGIWKYYRLIRRFEEKRAQHTA